MNIERLIQKPLSSKAKVTGLRYTQSKNPKNVVLFQHGIGERGPADGSQIQLLEKLQGFPRFARGQRPWSSSVTGNIEYEFDIFAPQIVDNYDNEINPYILPFLNVEYGYTNIILAGISLGNYAAWKQTMKYPGRQFLRGIVAVCGSGNKADIPNMEKLPGIAWHGTADPTVSYSSHKSFVDAYNAAGGEVEWNALDGVAHNAWTYAFNADPSKDKSLQKVNQIFASIPASDDTAALERENADLKAKVENARRNIQDILSQLPKI